MTTNSDNNAARKLAEDALKLADAATKGPWEYKEGLDWPLKVKDSNNWDAIVKSDAGNGDAVFIKDEDGELMAASRLLVPDLATALLSALDRNEQLERVLEAARAFVTASKVGLDEGW